LGSASCASNIAEVDLVSGVPSVCVFQQRAWCIQNSNVSIEPGETDFENKGTWIVSGSYWRDLPAVIASPPMCRELPADTVELLEAGQSINWSGRNWQITRVRLRRDGQCDIDLLVPTLADDPRGTAFSRSLGDLRPCRDHTCSGATLITALRQRVERI
jgi:hypothetical protein